MLTYLMIGVSVQVVWYIFAIIRKLPSVMQLRGLVEWISGIIFSAINIMLWPIALVVNIVASYHTELLND